jgi:tetratricopeptide (TPR) repeat protein
MAVMAHRPGEVDQPLLDMAEKTPEIARILVGDLEKALRQEFRGSYLEARNDVRRRAALLHTDIALLLPRQAAAFRWKDAVPTRAPAGSGRAPAPAVLDSLVYMIDGQYVATEVESGHWPFASWLLSGIKPEPSSDEFVRLWYRAVAATFLNAYLFGNNAFHLMRAREVLPRDPVLLFYAAAMQEALASPRVQNVQGTQPSYGYKEMNGRMISADARSLPSERDLLQLAARYLREALRWGAPPEAALRLGRVTGRLGRHDEAVTILEHLAPPASEVRLAYFRELFLGTEYAVLGRVDEARASFERAAALCPTAQAPLIALSDVCRRAGDRAAVLEALHRLEALPPEGSGRTDPWWDYYRSYAADAEQQLAAVRAWFGPKGER